MGDRMSPLPMKLLLHWLRWDLRRHALPLFAWLLLAAAFTAARVWFRTHPQIFIGDRDLWLSVPAAALGFAEVGLLLQVLLDDPARGPRAFWKTRPPSGTAVYAAKAVIILLVSLVVPLAADAVFLAFAGRSGGGPERLTLYLIPPAFAFMAGIAAVTWKRVLIWLPVTLAVLMGVAVALLFTEKAARITEAADIRVIAAALLAAAALWAFHCYRRRGKPRAIPMLTGLLPPLAAYAVACTGWHPGRDTSPPHSVDTTKLSVQWQPSFWPRLTGGGGRHDEQHSLILPLEFSGLPAGMTVSSSLRSVQITPDRSGSFLATSDRVLPASYRGQRIFEESDPGFSLNLTADQAAALRDRDFDIEGTVRLLFYERKPQAIPLNGTHTIRERGCQWKITPFIETSVLYRPDIERPGQIWWRCTEEFISDWPVMSARREAYIDRDSTFFVAPGGRKSIRVDMFNHDPSLNVWEGVGRHEVSVNIGVTAPEEAETFRRLIGAGAAAREGWELHFDVMVYAGTLDLPFSLHGFFPYAEAASLHR